MLMKLLAICAALCLTISVIGADLVSGDSKQMGLNSEYQQRVGQTAQSNPDLNLIATKQSLANEQQIIDERNKGMDLATIVRTIKYPQQQLLRVQRSVNQASLFPIQLTNKQQKQAYEDEDSLLRHSLPVSKLL